MLALFCVGGALVLLRVATGVNQCAEPGGFALVDRQIVALLVVVCFWVGAAGVGLDILRHTGARYHARCGHRPPRTPALTWPKIVYSRRKITQMMKSRRCHMGRVQHGR